jgi:hypothetical protein
VYGLYEILEVVIFYDVRIVGIGGADTFGSEVKQFLLQVREETKGSQWS